ncbi:hypothetical protein BDN67DRAFT_983785 [Paxillus ammoniavirescens]|nr:hypothetical protein BDN67DRAFT_983785 [Paxillus ammoniavirescens]
MALPTSSFLPWTSLSMLESFSSTPPPPYQLGNSESYKKVNTQPQPPDPSTNYAFGSKKPSVPEQRPSSRISSSSASSRTIDLVPLRFNSPLPSSTPSTSKTTTEHKPRPYPPNLLPLPSPYRPHCLAKDRLCLWIPASPSVRAAYLSSPNIILETALNRILEVIGASWGDSTKELYSTAAQERTWAQQFPTTQPVSVPGTFCTATLGQWAKMNSNSPYKALLTSHLIHPSAPNAPPDLR